MELKTTRKYMHYKLFGHIFIHITDRCNLRCEHCYVRNEKLDNPEEYSLEEIVEILKYFRVFGSNRVTLLGGEPTLHPDIVKIISKANDRGYRVYLDTNGMFSSELLKKVSPQNLEFISFSLDGSNEEINRKIRGEGVFSTCVKNIKHALKLGFDVRITPTIMKINFHDAFNIVKLADKLGVPLVNFHKFIPRGRGLAHRDWMLSRREWMNLFKKIKMEKENCKCTIWFPPEWTTQKEYQKYFKEGYKGCIVRYLDRCTLFPNGDVYLCSLLYDFPYNFAKWDGSKLVLSERRNNEINFEWEIREKCLDCKYSTQCFGGCFNRKILYKYLKIKEPPCDLISLCPLWKTTLR